MEVRISKELFSFLRECFIAMHFLRWPSNYVTKNLNILYIQMRIWGKPHDMYNLVYIHVSKSFLRICLLFFSVFEEPEDPTNRSFFSEIISSISDVKFSNSGRYMISRDYLSVKVWDLHMETKPIETYTVRLFSEWRRKKKQLKSITYYLNKYSSIYFFFTYPRKKIKWFTSWHHD